MISPEGCAAILWKDGSRADEAAEQLKITAPDLLELGVVDAVVHEPTGGAHQDHDDAAARLDAALTGALASLSALSPDELVDIAIDAFGSSAPSSPSWSRWPLARTPAWCMTLPRLEQHP